MMVVSLLVEIMLVFRSAHSIVVTSIVNFAATPLSCIIYTINTLKPTTTVWLINIHSVYLGVLKCNYERLIQEKSDDYI